MDFVPALRGVASFYLYFWLSQDFALRPGLFSASPYGRELGNALPNLARDAFIVL